MAIEVILLPDGRKRVFITAGTTSWPDPGDFDPNNNTIECVGAGGPGGNGGASSGSGSGGGGGGYYRLTNAKPQFPVAITIAGPTGNHLTDASNFGDLVLARVGGSGAGVSGGQGGFGSIVGGGFVSQGGRGGGGMAVGATARGGGGGGSGGPNGNSSGTGSAGSAGAADVPGVAGPANSGVPFQWDAAHVLGNGGNGGGAGVAGGTYGGGGGGSGVGGGVGGAGGLGLIVVTYKRLLKPPKGHVKILRSETSGNRPSGRLEDEPYVNIPDRTIGIIRDNAPRDIAAPFINYGGFVNKFRNPGFDIWQRGWGNNEATLADFLGADGWRYWAGGASTGEGWHGRGPTLYALCANGSPGADDAWIWQWIESYVSASLGRRMTVQAQIYNETGVSFAPLLWIGHPSTADTRPYNNNDIGPVALQTCPPGVWTRVSYTCDLSPFSAALGLEVDFQIVDALNGAGRWILFTEADIRSTPGWPVGLCDNPPPPELRPFPIELMFCQRYFEKSYNHWVPPGAHEPGNGQYLIHVTGLSAGQHTSGFRISYKVKKRADPTVTLYAPNGQANAVLDGVVGWNVGISGMHAGGMTGTCPIITSATAASHVNLQFYWTASAEL